LSVIALALPLLACTASRDIELTGSIRVVISLVDGVPPPQESDAPLPPNLGDVEEAWTFVAEALDAEGNLDSSFSGYTRASAVPGAVNLVQGTGAVGRNIKFEGGRAEGVAYLTAMFGPTRLWLADIGYVPAAAGETPTCSNGRDDDGDVTGDFPNDPGCAFADDMSEEEGSNLTGVSDAVRYELPTIAEVQGRGSATPYPAVAVDIKTQGPSFVVVTRVSSNGFFVTDTGDPDGAFNHMFAFNFNTPAGLRVCNRLDLLAGTAAEFFGFTEINFPSYEVGRIDPAATTVCERDISCDPATDDMCCPAGMLCERLNDLDPTGFCQPCMVPEPYVVANADLIDDAFMETLESGLVTIEQARIAPNLGPDLPQELADNTFVFDSNASNCDLNGDGTVDFFDPKETACGDQCSNDPECSEWTGFASRGNYKLHKDDAMVQVNTSTAQGFDPRSYKGQTLQYLTGTLRNFSGGSLNWTIETRCADDLGCNFDPTCKDVQGCLAACAVGDAVCEDDCNAPRNPSRACITPATQDDNDAGTN